MRYRITLIVASLLTALAVPVATLSAEAATYPLQLMMPSGSALACFTACLGR
jgi:hypothetical protein